MTKSLLSKGAIFYTSMPLLQMTTYTGCQNYLPVTADCQHIWPLRSSLLFIRQATMRYDFINSLPFFWKWWPQRAMLIFWKVRILSNAFRTTVFWFTEALKELLIGRGKRKESFGINLLSLLPYLTTQTNVPYKYLFGP
jgi:hypothetical protein